MIEVFLTRKAERICAVDSSFTESEIPEEIAVRASVVTILHTAVLGLIEVAGIAPELSDGPEGIKFRLPDTPDAEQAKAAGVILDTMLLGIADLSEAFSDFLTWEVREE